MFWRKGVCWDFFRLDCLKFAFPPKGPAEAALITETFPAEIMVCFTMLESAKGPGRESLAISRLSAKTQLNYSC